MKRGTNIPYWLKGVLLSTLILAVLIFTGFIARYIGLALPGMYIILALLGIANILGGVIGELINLAFSANLKLVEGGGSPTLVTQLLAFGVYISFGAFIGWVCGQCRKQ